MKKTCISKDWSLHSPHYQGPIDLPNDYSVTAPRDKNAPGGGDNSYFVGGTGRYQKELTVDALSSHYILDVDGAYMCAAVYCNGYAPSLNLLEICDELGMIVMDEAFDCWRREKGGVLNYHVWFDDWWARDIAAMVLRDRNHPCVLSYSIGNEIPKSDGLTDGDIWSARLVNEVRKYDATRPVTAAVFPNMAKLMGARFETTLTDSHFEARLYVQIVK